MSPNCPLCQGSARVLFRSKLQVALRSTAQTNGLHTDEQLAAADEQMLAYVRTLQSLLFALAACF